MVCGLMLAVALFLQASLTVAATEKLDILEGARLMFDARQEDGTYQLVTSSIKKVNNQWRAEKQQTLNGTVQRGTYELPSSVTYSHAKRKLLDHFVGRQGYRRVFTCEGLDCGSSSGWANEFLNVKQLFGLDNYQNYSVWEMTGQRKGYVVLYLVQRGNRRIYLQRDVIDLAAPPAGQVQLGLGVGRAQPPQQVAGHRDAGAATDIPGQFQRLVVAATAQAVTVQGHRHDQVRPRHRPLLQAGHKQVGQAASGRDIAIELEPRHQAIQRPGIAAGGKRRIEWRLVAQAAAAHRFGAEQGFGAARAGRFIGPQIAPAAGTQRARPGIGRGAAQHAAWRQQPVAGRAQPALPRPHRGSAAHRVGIASVCR